MTGMSRIEVVVSSAKVEGLIQVLNEQDVPGITVSHVIGCGKQRGAYEYELAEVSKEIHFLPKQMLTVFVGNEHIDRLVDIVKKELYTGRIGDGKIFISPVSKVIRIRTGEEDAAALK